MPDSTAPAVPHPPAPGAAAVPPTPEGPPRDLGRVAARGAGITLAGQGARILLQLASVTVLARLLDPRDYGLFAVGLVVVGVGEVVVVVVVNEGSSPVVVVVAGAVVVVVPWKPASAELISR